MDHEQWRHEKKEWQRPALVGLAAGVGLGAAATVLVARWMVARRVTALAPPLRWAVKRLVRSLR
jgi:hypothetical protein